MLLRAFALTVPQPPLFTAAADAVPRLLEMCADDSAVRRHGAPSLLRGLVALASSPKVAVDRLGAADTAVLARASRLAIPAQRGLRWWDRALLTSVIGVTVSAPAFINVLCHH